jgi:hypothetical protein
MRSQWKRLAWAALLSCACFAATLLWYKSTENDLSHRGGEAPLAQVGRVGDEVMKKPATRLLWQVVNTGDYLYNNESIRTSNRGEIRIQFEDGRYIDLEPDSLVVLQKSKGEIALDLMEGSVFVNAKNGTGEGDSPGLVLNSNGNKVDLSGASASLSKGKGTGVDMQVLEGKATIKDKDGKSKEVTTGTTRMGSSDSLKIEVLSPVPQKPYYIDADATQPVAFKWKGFPAQYKVTLMAGPSRKELKEWAVTESAGLSELQAKFAMGKYFWKLVGHDPVTNEVKGESPVYKTEFMVRYAPTSIFPVIDAELPSDKFPSSVTFKWQKGDEAEKVTLEVASDKLLKTKLANKTFTTDESFKLDNLKEGDYFWRLSAYYPDSDKPITGKIQKFSLVKLQHKDPVRIAWTLSDENLKQYFIEKPLLHLTWKPENRLEEIAGFRIRLSDEESGADQALSFQSKEPQFKASIPKAGRYIASVEAYDKEGNTIGRSDPKTLMASAMPLLSAPQIIPVDGVLKSQNDGRSEIKWQALDGAKEYEMVVTSKDGKELAKKRYQGTGTSLKNLLPGEYVIKLMAVDQFGRIGQEGTPRTLVVPNQSDIHAPKMKKIKVN